MKQQFGKWVCDWLETYVKYAVKEKTYSIYSETIRLHILPKLGDKGISKIDKNSLQAFFNEKRESGNIINGNGLSSNSIKLIQTILNAALDEAVEQGLIKENPCNRIKRQSGEKDVAALERDEQKKLEKHIRSHYKPHYIGIFLSLHAGLRLGEILALEWKDYDEKNKMLKINKTLSRIKTESGYVVRTVNPKTNAGCRQIPVMDSLAELLSKQKKTAVSNLIVCTKKNNPICMRAYQKSFERILNKIGIKRIGFHSLRHTFATRAMESGMDFKTLSVLMGHTNPSVTIKKYTHSMKESQINQMANLENYVNKVNISI